MVADPSVATHQRGHSIFDTKPVDILGKPSFPLGVVVTHIASKEKERNVHPRFCGKNIKTKKKCEPIIHTTAWNPLEREFVAVAASPLLTAGNWNLGGVIREHLDAYTHASAN